MSGFASLRRFSSRRIVTLAVFAAVIVRAQQPLDTSAQTSLHPSQASWAQQSAHHLAGRVRRGGASASAQLFQAQTQHATLLLQPRAQSFTAAWTPLGPTSVLSASYGNVTGRVTSIAFDPNDSTGNTVYLGTTGGGLWKSTNAAAAQSSSVRFAPLTDTLAVYSSGTGVVPSLSIGAVAVQPSPTAVILAGTGDPNDATDSLYGQGILRSTDSGATWTLVRVSQDGTNGQHSFFGLSTAGLAWSTATPTLAVAAFSSSPVATVEGAGDINTVSGLYYSTDAGVTWRMATLYDGANVVQTAQPLGTGQVGNPATSVVWDAQRGSFYAAVRNHGYYGSTDGITWKRLSAQPGSSLTTANCPVGATGNGASTCPVFRGALAVQPVTGDLFALTVDSSNRDQGLWMDTCNAGSNGSCSSSAPTFASRVDNSVLEIGSGRTAILQGSYDLSLAAIPSSSGTLLYAGTVDLYRCALTAGTSSCTWRNTTNALNGCNAPAAVAPAQHALAGVWLSASQSLLLLGNDGGLWRSTDGVAESGSACDASDKSHFDNLNPAIGTGGSLAEVVGFAQAPQDAEILLAGLGASGSAATSTASALAAWPQLSAGEGGFASIDPNSPSNWYAGIGAGINFKACTSGSACSSQDFAGTVTIGSAQVSGDSALLDAPFLLDPAQSSSLITATCRVWRGQAATGSTWSSANAISTPLSGSAPCTASSPLARSLAAGGPSSLSAQVQNSGSQVLYAGLAGVLDGGTAALGGHLFRTSSAQLASSTTAWSDLAGNQVTNDLANAYVFNPLGFDLSSVTIDPHDSSGATVYTTVMGFGSAGVVVPHLYRSVDFGAHWLNVTSNLPAAPANALVVDPNDANTLYVATDAGVYATTSITTCSSASCWNLLGTGLPNAPVTSLAAAAGMATGDGRLGMLRAGTYGRGIWQTPLLAATTIAQPGMLLTPTSLSFATQQVATLSASQSVTITSNGAAPLQITALTVSGDFVETDHCSGQTLAVGSSCTVNVVFAPTLAGTRTGSLVVSANISGGQASVALSGTATAPASVVLTPLALSFSATTVNQTSAAQVITVANTGGASSSLSTPVITGDFAVSSSTCGVSLQTQSACSLSIVFTPTASGTRLGTLMITSDSGTSTATLTGVGNAPATDALSPLSLDFGSQTLQVASTAQNVILTNSGDDALTLISAATNSSEFAVTNVCGSSLSGRSSCAISVLFAPSSVGTRSATLVVTDRFRSQSVSLTGVGVAPAGVTLTPSSLSFGEIGVGLSSTPQIVTLTNNGGVALTLSTLSLEGDFVLAASSCGTTLSAGASCTETLLFVPASAGARSGSLTLISSVGTKSVLLSGSGADFSLTANGSTKASLQGASGSATYSLLLSSVTGLKSTVSLGCTGAPAHASCAVSPSSTTLGATWDVSVVVATGVAGMDGRSRDQLPWWRSLASYALVMPLGWWALRRRRGVRSALSLPLALLFSLLPLLSGCGASRLLPSSGGSTGSSTTPSGTYTLTISATAAGVTHTVPLQLTVN